MFLPPGGGILTSKLRAALLSFMSVYWEKFWYHVPFHETRSFVIMFARAHQCALLWAVGFHEDNFIPFRKKKIANRQDAILSWKYTRFIGLLITGEDRYGLYNAVVSKGDNNDHSVLVDNRLFDQKLLTETRKNLVWFWRSEYCPYGNCLWNPRYTFFFLPKLFRASWMLGIGSYNSCWSPVLRETSVPKM